MYDGANSDFARISTEMFLETCAEIFRVGESYGICDFADRVILRGKHFFGTVQTHDAYVVV